MITMVLLGAASIVLGAVVHFVMFQARATRRYLAENQCRLAAQSVIEQAKVEIQEGFQAYTGKSGASVKIDPYQSRAYDWFDEVSADRRTIGKGDTAVTLSRPPEVNGCRAYVAIGPAVEHPANGAYAIVPVVATAERDCPGLGTVTMTVQERVIFGTGQSEVFDYAYFVNNYGWMNGSGITINGDMRANGNVSLSATTVNGFVIAAANEELGRMNGTTVAGTVTLSKNPSIKAVKDYRGSSNATSRSRPDIEDYNTKGAYDAPAANGYITKPTYDAQGNPRAGTGTRAAKSGETIVKEKQDSLPMPWVSELDDYVDFAREKNGTLQCPAYSYTDSVGTKHTIAAKNVSAHYDGAGPSENPGLADRGALVLIGTSQNPIRINGPVVVDSDVIIKGYVTGQGTIYSGRNVHIIGDLKYKDAPSWGHTDGDDAAVEKANSAKDMLGLVAKGNIIVGDSSTSAWLDSVGKYIQSGTDYSVVQAYECDDSDAEIGYPKRFSGDYTAREYVKGGGVGGSGSFAKVRTGEEVVGTRTERVKEKYVTGYSWWGVPSYGERWVEKEVDVVATVLKDSADRRYYETVCDNAVMNGLKDSTGITQIDAVLYNNHGIFGTPGRKDYAFNLNGSLVCRDEALIFNSGSSGIRFNWDMRLRRSRDNKVSDRIALPVGPAEPYTVDWLEVPASHNAAWPGAGRDAP